MFQVSTKRPQITARSSKTKLVTIPQEYQPLLSVVEAWNNADPTWTTHKITNTGKESKLIYSILERVHYASTGVFFEKYPDTLLYDYVLPEKYKTENIFIPLHVWPKIFRTYREYFIPGKGTARKHLLKTDLSGFIGQQKYGKRQEFVERKSWLWEVYDQGIDVPTIQTDITQGVILKEYPHLIQRITDILIESNPSYRNDKNEITRILAEMYLEYKLVKTRAERKFESIKPFSYILGSFEAFFYKYVEFVLSCGFDILYLGHFDVKKKTYTNLYKQKLKENHFNV
jgi:hypothetical protein